MSLIYQSHVSLQAFTTFGIAASARFYLRVTEVTQLQLLNQIPELTDVPRLVLGGGSNLILTSDFPGLVLHIALMGRERIGEDEQFIYVRAAAGEVWHDFVQWTLEQGWGGLENLSLIPGSVGAAPIQNIGAYGVEMIERFHSLSWFEFATGTIHTFTLAECQFAYRDSIFKNKLRDQGVI
jgi:UDP-N-acetylmuramate dehydrogenase